jgi:hypothetical protein
MVWMLAVCCGTLLVGGVAVVAVDGAVRLRFTGTLVRGGRACGDAAFRAAAGSVLVHIAEPLLPRTWAGLVLRGTARCGCEVKITVEKSTGGNVLDGTAPCSLPVYTLRSGGHGPQWRVCVLPSTDAATSLKTPCSVGQSSSRRTGAVGSGASIESRITHNPVSACFLMHTQCPPYCVVRSSIQSHPAGAIARISAWLYVAVV